MRTYSDRSFLSPMRTAIGAAFALSLGACAQQMPYQPQSPVQSPAQSQSSAQAASQSAQSSSSAQSAQSAGGAPSSSGKQAAGGGQPSGDGGQQQEERFAYSVPGSAGNPSQDPSAAGGNPAQGSADQQAQQQGQPSQGGLQGGQYGTAGGPQAQGNGQWYGSGSPPPQAGNWPARQPNAGRAMGTVGGLGVGAIMGAQIFGGPVAVAIGSLIGAVVGNQVGGSLGAPSKPNEEGGAMNSGPAPTNGPVPGVTGVVKAVPRDPNGAPGPDSYCREFDQTIVTADGEKTDGKAVACRQPDGTWKVM